MPEKILQETEPIERRIISSLKKILSGHAALHEPLFAGNEWQYVKECIDSGWVSSAGKCGAVFEDKICQFTGSKFAVVTVNGTAALHVCLRLADVKQDDEVLLPALTFVATANTVAYCGAIPHFVDCEKNTLGMDAQKLADHLKKISTIRSGELFNTKTGRRIKAVLPMHAFGHPVDIDPLVELCDRFKLTLIEDAAESLGSLYKGKHVGQSGRLAALSFNGNKIITTGGGGAILTQDENLAMKAKHLTTTAKKPHAWAFEHDEVGYNYRLPNINAALGVAQMEQLPLFLERKRKLAERYERAFQSVEGVFFFKEADFAKSNYWLNLLILDKPDRIERDRILDIVNAEGIMVRPAWKLMHGLPMFRDCPRMDLSVSENLENRIVCLPSSVILEGKIENGPQNA